MGNKDRLVKKFQSRTSSKDKLRAFLRDQDIGLAPLTPCARNLIQGCMPIKLLEYMAAGLSIVTSDLPVTRHVVGEGGHYFRSYSIESFANALKEAARNNKIQSLSENHSRIEEHFSRQKQRSALLSVYDEIS